MRRSEAEFMTYDALARLAAEEDDKDKDEGLGDEALGGDDDAPADEKDEASDDEKGEKPSDDKEPAGDKDEKEPPPEKDDEGAQVEEVLNKLEGQLGDIADSSKEMLEIMKRMEAGPEGFDVAKEKARSDGTGNPNLNDWMLDRMADRVGALFSRDILLSR